MAAVFGEWKPPRANETHGSSDASLAQIFSKNSLPRVHPAGNGVSESLDMFRMQLVSR
jgi:hypothetical protein